MSKTEYEFSSLEDLMKVVIKKNNLDRGLQKMDVQEAWSKMMGNGVVSYTESIQLQNKTLVVKLKSSVLREELTYGKEKIIAMLNEELGKDLITKLMLV